MIFSLKCPECGKSNRIETDHWFTQSAACPHCTRVYSVFLVDMAMRENSLGGLATEQLKRVKKEWAPKISDVTIKMKFVKARDFKTICKLLYGNGGTE